MKLVLIFLSLVFANHSWGNSRALGNWITDCNVLGRHSFISEVLLLEDKQSVTFKLFEDKACRSQASTVAYEGIFSVGKTFGEGIEFNSRPAKVNFTVHIQSVIDQYNRSNGLDGCGLKNWKLDVPQDVSGRYCRPFEMPTINKIVYDIYEIQGNEMRFGGLPLNWNLSNPNFRPKKLSEVIYYQVP